MKKSKIISFQLFLGLWFLALSLSFSQAEIILTIGPGSGNPGSSENPVVVSLDNQDDVVRAVQVDVCDTDDYLTCTGCEVAERTSGLSCTAEENESGCCRVMLFDFMGGSIAEGDGPIFILNYSVSDGAPAGECKDLIPEEVSISDESGDPFPSSDITLVAGEFCFHSGTTSTTTTTTTLSIDVLQDPTWKSHWIPLPYLMVIEGKETHFECFKTRLSFEPPLAIFPCFQIVWDNFYIWDFVLVMPGWLAGFEDQTVTVTVTTGDEVVSDDFTISLLPLILNQERSLR